MTKDQKAGQLACIANAQRALFDLERAVIITGLGLNQVASLHTILGTLQQQTKAVKITRSRVQVTSSKLGKPATCHLSPDPSFRS